MLNYINDALTLWDCVNGVHIFFFIIGFLLIIEGIGLLIYLKNNKDADIEDKRNYSNYIMIVTLGFMLWVATYFAIISEHSSYKDNCLMAQNCVNVELSENKDTAYIEFTDSDNIVDKKKVSVKAKTDIAETYYDCKENVLYIPYEN